MMGSFTLPRSFCFCAISVAASLFFVSSHVNAQVGDPVKILDDDGAFMDYFGRSVAIEGDIAVAGATFDAGLDVETGTAFVFERQGDTWVRQAQLIADDGGQFDVFGVSASIENGVIFVGAYHESGSFERSGAVYAFEHIDDEWIQTHKIVPDDPRPDGWFGWCVAADGNRLVVGARGHDANGSQSGCAYVFEKVGASWTQQSRLQPSDVVADTQFGTSVAIRDDVMVVGAPGDATVVSRGGAAYMFEFDGASWAQTDKMFAPDVERDDHFGIAVGTNGTDVLVGSFFDDDQGSKSGSVYAYRYEAATCILDRKILPEISSASARFGNAISMDGATAVIGAYMADNNCDCFAGSAHVFQHDGVTWHERARLVSSDAPRKDWFGYAVGLDGQSVIVGTPHDNDKGDCSGSAFIFEIAPTPVITLSGPCPGTMQISISNATPGACVVIGYATGTGMTEIAQGPCLGSFIGLDSGARVAAMLFADENGAIERSVEIDPARCGSTLLQAVDLDTCLVSHVVVLGE